MRIALWDIDVFADSKRTLSETGWSVEFLSPADCGKELLAGNVDAALVPSVDVLRNTDAFSVLPGAAFASRRGFPYVSLSMNRPISEIRTVRCSKDSLPFYPIASVVLREQYECPTALLREGEPDAELVFGSKASGVDDERGLDIALEWFELTASPLAWGFFAVRPGTPADSVTAHLQERLSAIVRDRQFHSQAGASIADVGKSSTMREENDPEVQEGIDDLAHYLFYVGFLEDIPAVRLMATSH